MVKRCLDQSTDAPMRLIWLRILSPYSCFHSQTRSTKGSRPSSCLVWPWAARERSTTFWVAMPAWSVPGTQSTL
jgi:hypothetical protein